MNLTFVIGLRSKPQYSGLSRMVILDAEMNQSVLNLLLSSEDESIQLWIGLDLVNERLVYNPYDGMNFTDRGTKDSLVSIKSFMQFRKDLFLNGCFEIRNAGNNEVLGYTDAFIPNNIDLGRTIKNFEATIEEVEKILVSRQ